MLAAKHFDIVTGIDIHIILIPTPGGPIPTPLPHPFVGIMFDPDDYDPMLIAKAIATVMMAQLKAEGVIDFTPMLDISNAISEKMGALSALKPSELIEKARSAVKEALGVHPPNTGAATIFVNNLPRIHCGSKGEALPPHIPMGGPFQKGKVPNECEAFMGSMTVMADQGPMTFMGCLINSCSCIGMPSMHNSGAALFMPTSIVTCIPLGNPILVGGPPVPDLNAILNKLIDKLFDKALDFLRNNKYMKALSQAIHNAAKKLMDKLGIPADSFIRDLVHDEICATTGHPVTIATGKVFTTATDFRLPGPIPLRWSRKWKSTSQYSGMYGNGWHCNHDLALAWDRENNVVVVRMKDGRPVIFPPIEIGEKFTNTHENLTLERKADHFVMREKNLYYEFATDKGIVKRKEEVFPLAAIKDARGFKIQFEYEASTKHLQKIIDSTGRQLYVDCDSYGRIINIQAPHPKHEGQHIDLVKYKYDAHGNLIERKDALGKNFTYRYKDKLLVQETNRNGLSFYFEYDEKERCIHTWGDGGIYDHKLEYNLDEKWTKVTDSLGNTSQYFWNDKGIDWKRIDPKGNTQYRRFTRTAKLQSVVNELGQSTSYEYDEEGNKTKTIYPDGTSIDLSYEDGLLVGATDQNGGAWEWKYNEQRQLVQRTDCLGRTTQYTYKKGLLNSILDPAGGQTLVEYDENVNLHKMITPDGEASRWQYDLLGRPIASTDPKGNTQKRKYDYLGRVRKVWERDGNIREFEYDAAGNVTRAKDKQHDVSFEYAQMNRLKARNEAGTRVEFKYDTEGNLLGIINEHGYAYRFELDETFRVQTESGFDGITRRYQRDALGRVEAVERASGIRTDYEYDLMGRVMEVQHSNGASEKYAYRADGELIEATNDHLKVLFERDALGRIEKEIQGGFEVTSKYDMLGLRTEVNSSLGAHVEFERNIMGDVQQVQADVGGSAWQAEFKRDNFGLELERLLPGNVQSAWKRDRLGRPIEQQTSTGGKTDRTRAYTWDVNSRLKQIEDSKLGTTIFEHDAFGNLASATYGDGSQEFRVPDTVGNLFRKPDRSDRKYGKAGQLLEADGTHYEYDKEGNLIRKIKADGAIWQYQWNAAGMLQKVIRPDGHSVSFTYDALGRRIAKKYRKKLTRWVWDGNNMLHEWVENTTPEAPYPIEQATTRPSTSKRSRIKIRPRKDKIVIGQRPQTKEIIESPILAQANKEDYNSPLSILNSQLTTWVFEPGRFAPLAKLQEKEQFSIVTDHLGTPTSMYNSEGQKTWEMDLSIYGEARAVNGWRDACPFRYPGQYEDEETGLYYNRFRYYDAEGGFYVSQDPIGLFGGLNIYSYVTDTLNFTDVFGLSEECGPDDDNKFESRKDAFRAAKRDAGIRMNQHPDKVESVPMTDRRGKSVLGDDGLPIMTREYHYTRDDGKQIVIQDHSAGHKFDDGGKEGSHLNVRPAEDTRHGEVEGTKSHYYFPD